MYTITRLHNIIHIYIIILNRMTTIHMSHSFSIRCIIFD